MAPFSGRRHAFLSRAAVLAFVLVRVVADDAPVDDDEGIEQDALSSEQIRALHRMMDKNVDGRVSLVEIMAYSDEMRKQIAMKDIGTVLDEMDVDHDGKLSLGELMKDMAQWGESDEEDKKEAELRKKFETEKFKLSDRDGDGLLTLEELPALFYPETHEGVLELTARQTLEQKDIDGDGVLTPTEFWEGDVIEGDDLVISDEEKADFDKLDINHDGKLDLGELKAWESGRFHTETAMKRVFDLADRDSDMHITADEIDAAKELIAGSDAQYHLMEWAEHNEL